MRCWIVCLFIAAATLFSGCADQNPPAPPVGSSADPGETKPAAAASEQSESFPLTIASWEETQNMIAEHRGKVVVVDLWTTW
jgi:hypothetical protein